MKMHVTLSDTLAFCRSFVDGGFPFLVAYKRVVCLKIRGVLDLMNTGTDSLSLKAMWQRILSILILPQNAPPQDSHELVIF